MMGTEDARNMKSFMTK